MRTPILAAAVAAALLAGCGGGSSGPGPALPGSNPPSNGGSSLTPSDVAQTSTDAAFEPMDSGETDAAVGNGTVGTSSSGRAPQALGHGCHDRTTRTITVNPDGSVTVETIRYYDAACTQAERDSVATYRAAGGTATVSRTVTTFNRDHLQLGVRKTNYALTGSTGNGSWVVTSAFFAGSSTTPLTQSGRAAALGGSAYNATTGRIANDANPAIDASYGAQFAVTASVATDAAGDTTFTGERNGTFFKGSLDGLTLAAAPPFTVGGGKQLGTSSLNGSVSFDGDGNLTAVTLNGTLAGGNVLAVTSTTDASGDVTVNGTVSSPGGTQLETFTTDASGNGVLTVVATGAQVPIVDWHVVWS